MRTYILTGLAVWAIIGLSLAITIMVESEYANLNQIPNEHRGYIWRVRERDGATILALWTISLLLGPLMWNMVRIVRGHYAD